MKNTNKKRGFTLIELVVVVAVIAILTAVLVPTFAGIINKANRSVDEQMVAQMNTILSSETTNKPATPYEALAIIEANGFRVDNLSVKSKDYEMLWNAETNRIVLLNKGTGDVVVGELSSVLANNWKFVSNSTEASTATNAGYSVYLNDEYNSSSAVIWKGGVDVGNNVDVNVTLSNTTLADTVVIRTNGGNLTVDAPAASVNHYGYADEVDIVAVAMQSYHENGIANEVTLTKGNFVAEAGAFVNKIVVNAAADADFKLSAANDALVVAIEAGEAASEAVASKVTDLAEAVVKAPEDFLEDVDGVPGIVYVVRGAGNEVMDYADAFAIAGDKTIILLADIENAGQININAGEVVTLNLNGHTITTAEQSAGRHYYINNSGTLTIQNGTINARGIQNFKGAALTMATGVTVNAIDANGGACVWNDGGTLTITGGKYTALNGDYGTAGAYYQDPIVIQNQNGGDVTISGGNFTAASASYAISNVSGTLEISGGYFLSVRGVVATSGSSTTTVTGGYFDQKALAEIAPSNNTLDQAATLKLGSYIFYAEVNAVVTIALDDVEIVKGTAKYVYYTNNSSTINGQSIKGDVIPE